MQERSRVRRIWVTRDEAPDGPLTSALRRVGLEPLLEPVIERRVDPAAFAALESLSPDDWLVLTSAFAIEAVPLESARVPRVAVVGAASESIARGRGLRVELVAPGRSAASLFAELAPRAAGCVVCYARSSEAEVPDLPGVAALHAPVLYRTTARAHDATRVAQAEAIAFASPSAVRAVKDIARPAASIGPTTTAALRARGVEAWVEPLAPTFDALADAIRAAAG